MKLKFFVILFLLFSVQLRAQTPEQLLKTADAIRNPADSFFMKTKIETSEGVSLFDVYLKGQDKTLIVTKEPARDKGRNMLMLDRDFHAYIPNLKRSMRLSLSQKLSGQVANGDISRTRWSGDYSVSKEKEDVKEVQLLLKGNKDNLTYASIRLWLEKKTSRPLRAEYLALNGKTVLKKASFEDYKMLAGAMRPNTIKIEDTNKQTSYIRILEMNKKEIQDGFFTVRNMESLR